VRHAVFNQMTHVFIVYGNCPQPVRRINALWLLGLCRCCIPYWYNAFRVRDQQLVPSHPTHHSAGHARKHKPVISKKGRPNQHQAAAEILGRTNTPPLPRDGVLRCRGMPVEGSLEASLRSDQRTAMNVGELFSSLCSETCEITHSCMLY
jgi:hypothetical protein